MRDSSFTPLLTPLIVLSVYFYLSRATGRIDTHSRDVTHFLYFRVFYYSSVFRRAAGKPNDDDDDDDEENDD